MILIEIAIIIIIIGVQISFANQMQKIAEMKGHKEKYRLWCFLCPMLGYMLVNTLPDKNVVDILRKISEGNNKKSEMPSNNIIDCRV